MAARPRDRYRIESPGALNLYEASQARDSYANLVKRLGSHKAARQYLQEKAASGERKEARSGYVTAQPVINPPKEGYLGRPDARITGGAYMGSSYAGALATAIQSGGTTAAEAAALAQAALRGEAIAGSDDLSAERPRRFGGSATSAGLSGTAGDDRVLKEVRLGGASAGAAQHLNASAAALLAQRRGLFYNYPLQLGVGDQQRARDAMRASLGRAGAAPCELGSTTGCAAGLSIPIDDTADFDAGRGKTGDVPGSRRYSGSGRGAGQRGQGGETVAPYLHDTHGATMAATDEDTRKGTLGGNATSEAGESKHRSSVYSAGAASDSGADGQAGPTSENTDQDKEENEEELQGIGGVMVPAAPPAPALPPHANLYNARGDRWAAIISDDAADDAVTMAARGALVSGSLQLPRVGLTALFPPTQLAAYLDRSGLARSGRGQSTDASGRGGRSGSGEPEPQVLPKKSVGAGLGGPDAFGNTYSGRLLAAKETQRDVSSMTKPALPALRGVEGYGVNTGAGVVGVSQQQRRLLPGLTGGALATRGSHGIRGSSRVDAAVQSAGGLVPRSGAGVLQAQVSRPLPPAGGVAAPTVAAVTFARFVDACLRRRVLTELVVPHNRLSSICSYDVMRAQHESRGAPLALPALAPVWPDHALEQLLLRFARRVHLGNNRFRAVPRSLRQQTSLTSLDMRSNMLREVTPMHARNLVDLDVSANYVVRIGNLGACDRLRTLRAADNRLIKLPRHLRRLQSLKVLDLQSNHLLSLALLGADTAPPKPGAAAEGDADGPLPAPPSPPRRRAGEEVSGWLALPPATPAADRASSSESDAKRGLDWTGANFTAPNDVGGGPESEATYAAADLKSSGSAAGYPTPAANAGPDAGVAVAGQSQGSTTDEPKYASTTGDKATRARARRRQKTRMDWKIVEDPRTGYVAYFHKRTGAMYRHKPEGFDDEADEVRGAHESLQRQGILKELAPSVHTASAREGPEDKHASGAELQAARASHGSLSLRAEAAAMVEKQQEAADALARRVAAASAAEQEHDEADAAAEEWQRYHQAWQRGWDEENGLYYYFNEASGESQWEAPEGWQDEESEDLKRRKQEAEKEGVLVWEAVYGVPPPAVAERSPKGGWGAPDGVHATGPTGLQGLHQPSMVRREEPAMDEMDPFNSGLRHMGAADVDLGPGWDLTLATGDAAHAAVEVAGDDAGGYGLDPWAELPPVHTMMAGAAAVAGGTKLSTSMPGAVKGPASGPSVHGQDSESVVFPDEKDSLRSQRTTWQAGGTVSTLHGAGGSTRDLTDGSAGGQLVVASGAGRNGTGGGSMLSPGADLTHGAGSSWDAQTDYAAGGGNGGQSGAMQLVPLSPSAGGGNIGGGDGAPKLEVTARWGASEGGTGYSDADQASYWSGGGPMQQTPMAGAGTQAWASTPMGASTPGAGVFAYNSEYQSVAGTEVSGYGQGYNGGQQAALAEQGGYDDDGSTYYRGHWQEGGEQSATAGGVQYGGDDATHASTGAGFGYRRGGGGQLIKQDPAVVFGLRTRDIQRDTDASRGASAARTAAGGATLDDTLGQVLPGEGTGLMPAAAGETAPLGGVAENMGLRQPARALLFVHRHRGLVSVHMPPSADRWEQLVNLEVLNVRNNRLAHLPASLFRCPKLKRVLADHNILGSIPETVGECTTLEELSLQHNYVQSVPASIGSCRSLKAINLEGNRLQDLPPSMGDLSSLIRLRIGNNAIERLPLSFARLKALKSIALHGNPLQFPPDDAVRRGPEGIRWACRQAQHIYQRGAPPELQLVRGGTDGELVSSEGAMHAQLTQMVEAARSGDVRAVNANRYFESYDAVPAHVKGAIFKYKGLQELRLGFNGMTQVPGALRQLTKLQALSLRGNKLRQLPQVVLRDLEHMKVLDLARNQIVGFPPGVLCLQKLEVMDLSHNRLLELPAAFPHALPDLQQLDLSGNQLENLPLGMGAMVSLKRLTLDSNPKLEALPESLALCGSLARLDANRCALGQSPDGCGLPDSLGLLSSLKQLRIAYNRIRRLPRSLHGDSPLSNALESLWLQGNDLPDLGDLLLRMPALREIKLHHNPRLRSPPYRLLDAGVQVMRDYSYERLQRLHDVQSVLEQVGLEIDPRNLTPVAGWADRGLGLGGKDGRGLPASEKLVWESIALGMGGRVERAALEKAVQDAANRQRQMAKDGSQEAGYLFYGRRQHIVARGAMRRVLLPEDLVAIDAAADVMVNGDFYGVVASKDSFHDFVQALVDRRRFAWMQSQLMMFQDLIDVAFQQSLISDSFITADVKRPWGEDEEMIPCYGVDLDGVFGSQMVPRGLPIEHLRAWQDPKRYPLMVLVKGGPARLRQQEVEGRVVWPVFGKEEDSYWEERLEGKREKARKEREAAARERREAEEEAARQLLEHEDAAAGTRRTGNGSRLAIRDGHASDEDKGIGAAEGGASSGAGNQTDGKKTGGVRFAAGTLAEQTSTDLLDIAEGSAMTLDDIRAAAREGKYPRPNLARQVAELRLKAPEVRDGDWMWQIEPALAWDAPAAREDAEDLSDDEDDEELALLERGELEGVYRASSPRYHRDRHPDGAGGEEGSDAMQVEEIWDDGDDLSGEDDGGAADSGNKTDDAGGRDPEAADRGRKRRHRRNKKSDKSNVEGTGATGTGARRMAGDVEKMVLAGTGDYYLSGSESDNDVDGGDLSGDSSSDGGGSMGRQLTVLSGVTDGLDDLDAGDTITAAKRRRARRLLRRQGQRDAERRAKEEQYAKGGPKLPRAALLYLVPVGATVDIYQRRKRQRAMALEREARMDAGVGPGPGDDLDPENADHVQLATKSPHRYTLRGRPRREKFNKKHPYYRPPDIRIRNGKKVDLNHPVEAARRRSQRRHAVPLVFMNNFDLPREHTEALLRRFYSPYGPVAEPEAAVPFPTCPCAELASKAGVDVSDLVAYRSLKRGGRLMWGPLPQQAVVEREVRQAEEALKSKESKKKGEEGAGAQDGYSYKKSTSSALLRRDHAREEAARVAADVGERLEDPVSASFATNLSTMERKVTSADDAEARQAGSAIPCEPEGAAMGRRALLRVIDPDGDALVGNDNLYAGPVELPPDSRLQMGTLRTKLSSARDPNELIANGRQNRNAQLAAADALRTGLHPGEDDDVGEAVRWPRRDADGRRLRVVELPDKPARHEPACVRPGYVIAQRTLTREEASRRGTELREVIALTQRMIHLMRAWAVTPQGKRRIERRANAIRARAILKASQAQAEVREQVRLVETKRTAAAGKAAAYKATKEAYRKVQASNAYDHELEVQIDETKLDMEEAAVALRLEEDRLRRKNSKAEVQRMRAARNMVQWRSAALRQLERKQRDRAMDLVFEKNRRRAFRHGWRRLWDGDDGQGEDYKEWVDRKQAQDRMLLYRLMKDTPDLRKSKQQHGTGVMSADADLAMLDGDEDEDHEGWGGEAERLRDRATEISRRVRPLMKTKFVLDPTGRRFFEQQDEEGGRGFGAKGRAGADELEYGAIDVALEDLLTSDKARAEEERLQELAAARVRGEPVSGPRDQPAAVIGIAGTSAAAAAAEEAQRYRYVQGGLDPSASHEGAIAVAGGLDDPSGEGGVGAGPEDGMEAMRAKVREMHAMREGVLRLKAEKEHREREDAKLLSKPAAASGAAGDGDEDYDSDDDSQAGDKASNQAAGGSASKPPEEGEMTAAELMDQAAKLAGFDSDGGPLAEKVQTQLVVLGILPAPLAARRRYSFGSESSVDWEGKDKDEAEEEALRLEREEREAAEELAAEVRAEREALGLPPDDEDEHEEEEEGAVDGNGQGKGAGGSDGQTGNYL